MLVPSDPKAILAMACYIVLASVVFLVLKAVVDVFLFNGKQYPNGPRPLGLLGNFFTLGRLQSRPDQELMSLAYRFGDICMLWYGRNPVIIVNTPKAARDLLTEVKLPPSIPTSSTDQANIPIRKAQSIPQGQSKTNFEV